MERVGNTNSNQYNSSKQATSKVKKIQKRDLTPDEKTVYDKDIVQDSTFMKLFQVPLYHEVDDKSGKGLTYLSWAYAWAETKKRCPNANFKIYKDPQTGWNYFTDGKTCWVEVSVTIDDLEHVEMLPIMDNTNRSVPLENVTSVIVQKTHMRALTKACARHGLGLMLYGIEDLGLPEDPENLQPVIPSVNVVPMQSMGVAPIPIQQNIPAATAPMPVQQVAPSAPVQTAPVQAQPTKAVQSSKTIFDRASALVLPFGKHLNETMGSVLATDRSYVEYLADPTQFEAKTADAEKFQKAAGYMLNYLAKNPAA